MASEYNSCRFATQNHHSTGTNSLHASHGNSSFRTKTGSDRTTIAISFPTVKIKSTANTHRNNNSSGRTTSNATESSSNKSNQHKSYYSATKSFASKVKLPPTKSITTITNFNCNGNGSNIATATAANIANRTKAFVSSSGGNATEWAAKKYHCLNGSAKRIYSSMRITKKEMPYAQQTCVSANSLAASPHTQSRCKDDFDAFYKRPHSNRSSNVGDSRNGSAALTLKNNKNNNSNNNIQTTIAFSSGRHSDSNNPAKSLSYSRKFPNGLPFEDEFYNKKRQKSVSSTSKSELSDYGSIDNDSDQSLLPFDDEFSRRQPSTEALYVDFSKPISTTTSYSNASNTEFSGSNCSSNSSSCLNINRTHTDFDYSCKNYVCSPDDVIVRDQPLVYVAVQWCSNHSSLNGHDTKVKHTNVM